ncbi:MAG: hypothetical protein M1299_12360 [Firmicutes bacterium]|nr:hypothetical protein [Bacillota bacterium]
MARVQDPYQDRFSRWAERAERSLIRFVIILAVVVVVSQGLLTNEKLRLFLSYPDQLEGIALKDGSTNVFAPRPSGNSKGRDSEKQASLNILCVTGPSFPKAMILVNGVVAGDFSRGSVRIPVRNGDLVEIDGSHYPELLTFRLTAAGDSVLEPRVGREIITRQSIEILGRVAQKP